MLSKKNYRSDEELFRQIKKNDAKSLKQLYERYYDKLCHFSYGYVKSIDVSKDVVSDVFLNVWIKRETLTIETNLKAYFYKSTRNRALRLLSKEKSNFESLKIVDSLNMFADDTAIGSLEYEELESVIESILNKLPPKRQVVFRLSRIDKLSYKEIAEALSISVNTVQNHMIKAIKYLAEEFPKIKNFIASILFFLFL